MTEHTKHPRERTPASRVTLSDDQITSFIEGQRWVFAKTMPNAPHSYVVKSRCSDPHLFEAFVLQIRRQGYTQFFSGRQYTYLDWTTSDGEHQYWTMGAPLEQTIILNRARKARPVEI
jgi:hypothetical protein